MPVTRRQLNRSTLLRQLLVRREALPVVNAVRRVVAIQAQEPASPYVALWNRVERFDPADLDDAYAAGDVVKATLMRVTLHAVAAVDHEPFRMAMQPTLRAARLNDSRFKVTGLSIAEADALVPELLGFMATPRSNAEVEAFLDDRLGPGRGRSVWWALRSSIAIVHAPTGGPWSFGRRPAHAAAKVRVLDDATPLFHLIRRYLEGFGPATAEDIAQFARQKRSDVRAALEVIGPELRVVDGPDRRPLVDVPDGVIAAEDLAAPPRLLAMWDSVLLAYADRSRLIPPDYRAFVIRRNGDVLPTVLVDGLVAGVWRPGRDGGIEVRPFAELDEDTWAALADEARELTALLAGREPLVYRRYDRWWSDLPGRETRVLPAAPSAQTYAMPTIGLFNGTAPMEPKKAASPKAKMPPSEATSQ